MIRDKFPCNLHPSAFKSDYLPNLKIKMLMYTSINFEFTKAERTSLIWETKLIREEFVKFFYNNTVVYRICNGKQIEIDIIFRKAESKSILPSFFTTLK